jgi:DNA-binding NtrC family response regulator
MGYHFPGNVRELRAIIELAAVLTDHDQIDESHISFNSADAAGNLLMEESSLAEYTRKIIRYYLQKYNNNVLLVAKKLEIGKSTIYRMIKEKQI